MKRCAWAGTDPLMVRYHDTEWGETVHDDRKHFEFLVLEGAQAGLSWSTVLKKRENYRKAFSGFDPVKVAKYDEKKIAALLNDPGIIRNNLKVRSAIRNANVFLEIQREFGSFDKYLWSFVNGKPVKNSIRTIKDVAATSPVSDAVSRDLKKRGMNFVGSTVMYAHLQAVGVINDHENTCFRKH